jgi:hypothetical protein
MWDRGRLREFGIDLRGGWLHSIAGKLSLWIDENCTTLEKPWVDEKGRRRAGHTRLGRISSYLSCFCEPCWRNFLPWPLNW